MKAWSVTFEKVDVGIRVRDTYAAGVMPVVMPEGLKRSLEGFEHALALRAGGNVGFLPEIDRRSETGHIVSEGWIAPSRATDLLRSVKNRGWPLVELVFDREGRGLYAPVHLPRKGSGEALVHVCPVSIDVSSIRFFQPDPTSEEVEDPRNGGMKVVKKFSPGFGPGCQILHHWEDNGPRYLVKMTRGASFRMSRVYDPDNPEDPTEAVVVWTGGQMKVIPSRRSSEAAAA